MREAVDWYRTQSPRVALQFTQSYDALMHRIAENPLAFPQADSKTRKAVFTDTFPYTLYFRVNHTMVEIISVLHHKRSPTRWQKRH